MQKERAALWGVAGKEVFVAEDGVVCVAYHAVSLMVEVFFHAEPHLREAARRIENSPSQGMGKREEHIRYKKQANIMTCQSLEILLENRTSLLTLEQKTGEAPEVRAAAL